MVNPSSNFDKDKGVKNLIQNETLILEEHIEEVLPKQWFWFHKR
jgi:lauroyl/myristoyl acyltransferase